jgi:hypothetical protein
MNATPLRRLSDATAAATSAITLRAAFTPAKAVDKSMLAGVASVAAGTGDMVHLIRTGDKVQLSEGLSRGVANVAQFIGGLMLMSKSSDANVKAAGATLSVGGTLIKAADHYIPETKSIYANRIAKGAVLGTATAAVVQLAGGALRSSYEHFNPRALVITGTLFAAAGAISAACAQGSAK